MENLHLKKLCLMKTERKLFGGGGEGLQYELTSESTCRPNLSMILGTHLKVEGENRLHQVVL